MSFTIVEDNNNSYLDRYYCPCGHSVDYIDYCNEECYICNEEE